MLCIIGIQVLHSRVDNIHGYNTQRMDMYYAVNVGGPETGCIILIQNRTNTAYANINI
jgi:hypothetical protein